MFVLSSSDVEGLGPTLQRPELMSVFEGPILEKKSLETTGIHQAHGVPGISDDLVYNYLTSLKRT